MSRQCLSASGAGRALTPARHLCLGEPLPHQQANITWAPPKAMNLWSHDIIRYYPPSLVAIPNLRVGTHALLPLTPVPLLLGFPRLACLIHAANVRSEPGSNPSNVFVICPLSRAAFVRFNLAVVVRLVTQKIGRYDHKQPRSIHPRLAFFCGRLGPGWVTPVLLQRRKPTLQ